MEEEGLSPHSPLPPVLTRRLRAVVYDPAANAQVNGSWQPIPLLARNDSIVSLYNILPNSVSYLDKSYDPLFAATGVNPGTLSSAQPIYYGDFEATTLVCLDQLQWCNPLNGKCTAETYPVAALDQAVADVGLNDFQTALLLAVGHSGQLQ